MSAPDVLKQIRSENLGVYEASPGRLGEDLSQESEVANNYRGRLIYELLQNADDAMGDGSKGHEDRVLIRLTDAELWMGNSGRELDEADVRGLCGIGASSKSGRSGPKRASIGHKGMGFKSVLEFTDAPEVFSLEHCFRLGADIAATPVAELFGRLGHPPPSEFPAMRFPERLDDSHPYWEEQRREGIRTLFRFPFRDELDDAARARLRDRLLALPSTSILFLKHLEHVELDVVQAGVAETRSWTVSREVHTPDGWQQTHGLVDSGRYRIRVESNGESSSFHLAHESDLPIGDNRVGLSSHTWEGVELTEVSIAALIADGHPEPIPMEWRHLHVFLPTEEECPYPFLVNGAFTTDLSRQEVRVGPEADDYNRHLLKAAARLFKQHLVPEFLAAGSSVGVLRLLQRDTEEPGANCRRAAGQALYESVRDELSSEPLLRSHPGSELFPLAECAIPALVPDSTIGAEIRALLDDTTRIDNRRLPQEEVCAWPWANVAVDHGAHALDITELPELLAGADGAGVTFVDHESGRYKLDPVLELLGELWLSAPVDVKDSFVEAVRTASLFPVGVAEDGSIERVSSGDTPCFYPPQSLHARVPLQNLNFLAHDITWGDLALQERRAALADRMHIWDALFDIAEFKFPDVMRAAVLRLLTLDESSPGELAALEDLDVLAAICQLSGRTPDDSSPLPFERLGSNRGLFSLSRLPVPCRSREGEGLEWHPANRVYFGADWVGDASVERIAEAIRDIGAEPPEFKFLAPFGTLAGLLDRHRALSETSADEEVEDDDEVDLDEDDEAALDVDERERWLSFLGWLGVSRSLRLLHFNDVDDRGQTWLKTRGLSQPKGRAFSGVPDTTWGEFVAGVERRAAEAGAGDDAHAYFYEMHHLESFEQLMGLAAAHRDNEVASAVVEHLALNWDQLGRYARLRLAIVPRDLNPGRRSKPARAKQEELHHAGEDFWVWQLKRHDFCPTSHGPRRPTAAWLETDEVRRRFGRRGSSAAELLPLLETGEGPAPDRLLTLARALGVRTELTPTTFGTGDAMLVAEALERVWGRRPPERHDETLREVIRPAYRTLVELLTGEGAPDPAEDSALAEAPLLVRIGSDGHAFQPARKVFWARRSGTWDKLGRPDNIPLLELDAMPAARAPLTNLFAVRILEDEIEWMAEAGETALDPDSLATFQAGLEALVPDLRARLLAERADPRLASQDGERLQAFVDKVVPVEELALSATIDDAPLPRPGGSGAYAPPPRKEGSEGPYIVWGENPWPPTPSEAERLAAALCEHLEVNTFEAFLSLITSDSAEQRRRLLDLAGAPSQLPTMGEADDDVPPTNGRPTSDGTRTAGSPPEAKTPSARDEGAEREPLERTQLYELGDLEIAGEAIVVVGEKPRDPGKQRDRQPRRGGTRRRGGNYGGKTDLSHLDALGMSVAMAYERGRVGQGKQGGSEQLVFDVSTRDAIVTASDGSSRFRQALAFLERAGVNREAPGFDVLTLSRDGEADPIDRLIELKSSGSRARTQEMTWNEWKTAQKSALRPQFYLFLVGNLRRDIKAEPFLQIIRDPFETLLHQQITDRTISRRVKLDLRAFDQAEEVPISTNRAD